MPNYCHLAFSQDFAATLSDFLTLQLSRDYSSTPSLYALLCEKNDTNVSHKICALHLAKFPAQH
jgi:hypothetical protein